MIEKLVHWIIFLGLVGWGVGALVQLILYGAITTPCCQ